MRRSKPSTLSKRNKSRNGAAQKGPVTQEEFYEEGTAFEEQAERWLLSDIKKSLRFYLQALQMYRAGLTAPNSDPKLAYDILYNETRLLLQMQTDFLSNEGYINILKYVNMNDMPDLSSLLLPLPEIIQKFEIVSNMAARSQDSWDLEFNLLTLYLMLLEESDIIETPGDMVVQAATRFIETCQTLVKYHLDSLHNWEPNLQKEESVSNLQLDTIHEHTGLERDGSGIKLSSTEPVPTEIVDMSDHMTSQSLSDTLVTGYKFVQTTIEMIIELRMTGSDNTKVNAVQAAYIEDIVAKFHMQLNDIVKTGETTLDLDTSNINNIRAGIEGIQVGAKVINCNTDISLLANFLSEAATGGITVELLLSEIDVLEFTITQSETTTNLDLQWKLCSLLSKTINQASTMLSNERQLCLNKPARGGELSHTIFRLCTLFISNSDNELRRFMLKKHMSNANVVENEKILDTLLKNATTLLKNTLKISQQPCGLQETVIDKLKRNEVYTQASARIGVLENTIDFANINPNVSDILGSLQQTHQYYKEQLSCFS